MVARGRTNEFTYAHLSTLGQENLDELVHESKAEEAAAFNNSGRDHPVAYLITANGNSEPKHFSVLLALSPEELPSDRLRERAALEFAESGLEHHEVALAVSRLTPLLLSLFPAFEAAQNKEPTHG